MGKAHSSALLECPFFFKNGVQPVRKVIVGRHEAPLQQAAADFGWEEYSTDWPFTVATGLSVSTAMPKSS